MGANETQLVRLLSLIPYLQAHPGITVEEAARTFDVTPATISKDLNILWFCGLPGGAGGDLIDVDMESVEGAGVIHLSNAEYMSRPLSLTADEAFSLVLALEYVGGLTGSGLATAAASALVKLRAALGERPYTSGTVVTATASQAVRDAVEEAIATGRSLELVYDGQHRYSTPTVDPARVVVRQGAAYLQAWSQPRQDWRTYRMERIADARVSNERAGAHGTPPEVPADWNDALPFTREVTLTVSPAGRWIAEYHPVRAVETTLDGAARITLGVADDAWLRQLLLRLGPNVLAVEPVEVGVAAREAAAEALAHYAAVAGRVQP